MNILVVHKIEEVDLKKFWRVEAAGVESIVNTSYREQIPRAVGGIVHK